MNVPAPAVSAEQRAHVRTFYASTVPSSVRPAASSHSSGSVVRTRKSGASTSARSQTADVESKAESKKQKKKQDDETVPDTQFFLMVKTYLSYAVLMSGFPTGVLGSTPASVTRPVEIDIDQVIYEALLQVKRSPWPVDTSKYIIIPAAR